MDLNELRLLAGSKDITISQTEASAAFSDDFALCVIKMYKSGGKTGTFARPIAMRGNSAEFSVAT